MLHNIKISKTEPNKGILDYSYLLDAPAGKHGFVETKNGHLYFEDGTRAKFLGFNIAARSNTPDHDLAEKLAERFASMGVNIIRLHAADAPISEVPCSWSSCKETPLLDYPSGSSREFNKSGLDRFDYFVAKLKEKGIYLHIDLIVAREFLPGDALDYPGYPGSCIKRYPMYNRRLIELQKEYAKKLLCHVNPYTGLALIDDPAVVTIQLNNEESAIKGTDDTDALEPYKNEVQKRFNDFLLMKYYTRDNLKEAWTKDGSCALGEDEDPEKGTVEVLQGGFYQPVSNPNDSWSTDPCSPPRYGDFMEFGILMNRKFYQTMKNYIQSLGAKVPIVTSNLVAGAADVYGHIDGDIIENNCYFNHPIPPFKDPEYIVPGPGEYVSTNPLTIQKGVGAMANTLVNLASVAIIQGKPFMLSEWNEYGEHPFHSTAVVHTVAYGCLNDWDGLILYNHHTSEKDDQPDDEIRSIFDVYNDPAVICQWGFMASIFLKGIVSKARHRVDVVYTQNDLRTFPNWGQMPTTFFPYVTAMRNVFLDGGDTYQGDGDIAVNAGFLNGADLSGANKGVYYAWSPYRDAGSRYLEKNRLIKAARGTTEIQPGVHLGDRTLVFDEIMKIAGDGDYRSFAAIVDKAMKMWKVMPEDCGFVDGKLISDTKELIFDPDRARFQIQTPYCGYFSGAPEECIVLSDKIQVKVRNERISLSLLPVNEGLLNESKEYVLTAMGKTGVDEMICTPGPEFMGMKLNIVTLAGKLYAETMEGEIIVKAKSATLKILNPVGEALSEIHGKNKGDYVTIQLDGSIPGIQYHLCIKE